MSQLYNRVSEEVFERFSDYVRGVVIARGVTNGESPAELIGLLRGAEESVRECIGQGDITSHPRIAAWREAFRSLGVKVSEYRPSIEAMARRVLRGNELPSINALVDIGNILSMRHLVSMGGHAVDVVTQDMVLRPATGTEEFIPFGSDQPEHPAPGEIIFAEGSAVLTRRWCWRQANHTLTLPSTTAIEFNIDGLPPITRQEVEAICHETAELIQRFCGGEVGFGVITRQQTKIPL